jgi:hypothetical protein
MESPRAKSTKAGGAEMQRKATNKRKRVGWHNGKGFTNKKTTKIAHYKINYHTGYLPSSSTRKHLKKT